MLSLQNSAEYSVDVKFHVRRFKGGRLPFISTKKANLRDWQPRLVLSAPQLWTWPLWKGPGFPQRSRLRPLQEAAQNQVDVSLNAGKPPVYAQGLHLPGDMRSRTALNWGVGSAPTVTLFSQFFLALVAS